MGWRHAVPGYDIVTGGGRLIVNDQESRRVQDIFALFVPHRSLSAVVAEFTRRRWKTKSWTSQKWDDARGARLRQGVVAPVVD